jgi:hypothetical protein
MAALCSGWGPSGRWFKSSRPDIPERRFEAGFLSSDLWLRGSERPSGPTHLRRVWCEAHPVVPGVRARENLANRRVCGGCGRQPGTEAPSRLWSEC